MSIGKSQDGDYGRHRSPYGDMTKPMLVDNNYPKRKRNHYKPAEEFDIEALWDAENILTYLAYHIGDNTSQETVDMFGVARIVRVLNTALACIRAEEDRREQ